MSSLAVSNSFSALSEIKATPFNTNFSDIVTYINNRNSGSSAWDALSVTGTSTLTGAVSAGSTLGVSGVATFTGGIANLFGYRRPNLVFVTTAAVDVENNTGTSNQTTIVFSDGTIRSVTEDTASTHKYRRFLITAAAEFTSGTEDSGLRSGISEATNTWYAIYAVKSAINSANFVLAGDTTLPLQANFATLNTRYGTNGWVYLGLIRNGDNDAATGDILSFYHSGNRILFSNQANGTVINQTGTKLAADAIQNLTYTYSAGTGATAIPNHIKIVDINLGVETGTTTYTVRDSAASKSVYQSLIPGNGNAGWNISNVAILDGIRVSASTGTPQQEIYLHSFIDPLLDGTYQVL